MQKKAKKKDGDIPMNYVRKMSYFPMWRKEEVVEILFSAKMM